LFQDAGDLATSARWRDITLSMAHRAGDSQLISYALTNKAMLAIDQGEGKAVIDYALAALAGGRELSPKAWGRDHKDIQPHVPRVRSPSDVRRGQSPRNRASPRHRHPLATHPIRHHHTRRRTPHYQAGLRTGAPYRRDRRRPRSQASRANMRCSGWIF